MAPVQCLSVPESVLSVLRRCTAIAFDVDSTLVRGEGIDVLAMSGGGPQMYEKIQQATRMAMDGGMPFDEALRTRLEIMRPTKKQIEQCTNEETMMPLTDGLMELIKTMQETGIQMFVVSGGFRQMIEPIRKKLGIPEKNVYANTLYFKEDGSYSHFDEQEPTCRAGGKAQALRIMQEQEKHQTIVMVGDGATDLEAKPPAEIVIGYGGVVEREIVKKKQIGLFMNGNNSDRQYRGQEKCQSECKS